MAKGTTHVPEETIWRELGPVSAVHRVARHDAVESESAGLGSLLVNASSGRIVDGSSPGDSAAQLHDFAAAIPELFGPGNTGYPLWFGKLDAARARLEDLLLVAPGSVHFAQRAAGDPGLALVSISDRSTSIGMIVSEARARLARI